jgi:hypothetical protein
MHGDTKTKKSRRTLELPAQAAEALRKHHTRQAAQRLKAELSEDNNLVFCTGIGTALDAANVRRGFPDDHLEGRDRGRLDSPGAPSLVRLDHE